MIIAISNAKEKGIITRYLNRKYGTNYPTEFSINVKGYLAIHGKDYVHYFTRRAVKLSNETDKTVILFADFVAQIFDELQHLETIHETTLTAYHEAREECMKLRSKSEIRKQMFQQCFKL